LSCFYTVCAERRVWRSGWRRHSTTRFAITELTACVLHLDFWDEDEPNSIFFSKMTYDIVVSHLQIPEKVARTVKTHLEGEENIPDIATLITTIKDDRLVKENGTIIVLSNLAVAFINSGNYDARYRVLLRHIATLLCVVWEEFEDCFLPRQAKQIREKTQRKKKIKRFLLVGAAGGVGGVLIGLTGGLAAPLVAAGAGALIGSGAAGLATTAGAAVLGTTLGMAGAGLAGYKMNKRVGAIEEFAVEALSDGLSLHCTLVVSGWIEEDTPCGEAFERQWKRLNMSREQYTLRYESKYLQELGKAMDYIMSFAVSVAIQQTLMETALAGLLAAVAWPVTILSAASVLDNPWSVCVARAAEVGEHLAEVLLSRSHGKRPISLIGFSLGARVIYHCLLAMNKRAESAGIIEDVILLGAPVSASPKQWSQLCSVVGGRIINGYCETDWLLRFLYRTMCVQFTIAGTGPVDDKSNKKKIFNYNLSHIVKGHLDYSRKLTEVLAAVGVRVKELPTIETSDKIVGGEEGQDGLTSGPSMQEDGHKDCLPAETNKVAETAVRDKLNI
uniref:Transmembrane and coiled-coil domain-containing protein 4 n=1 Tax=Angiostrongylus cantonensis TaxID=6313 RepID=A0A0K0CXB5_ANGCA